MARVRPNITDTCVSQFQRPLISTLSGYTHLLASYDSLRNERLNKQTNESKKLDKIEAPIHGCVLFRSLRINAEKCERTDIPVGSP